MHLPIFSILPIEGLESGISWLFTLCSALLSLAYFYFAGKEKGAEKAACRKWGFVFFVGTIVSALCIWMSIAVLVVLICLYTGKWLAKDVIPNIWAGIRNK